MLIHVVKKGEVLWQIAAYYRADIYAIIEFNSLINSNMLLEGQALIIPAPGLFYTVKHGDTLWSIANKFKIPIKELMYINKIVNPNILYPNVTLIIPQKPKKGIEVNAFTYVNGVNDISLLRNTIDYLTYLSPLTYSVQKNGTLLSIYDDQAIQFAILNNVIPVMSISNIVYNIVDEDIMHFILNDMQAEKVLLENIVATMKEKNYRGLNVYFENISLSDKEAYNNFLQLLSSRLHQEGFFISSILAPKASEKQSDTLAHDYEAHGRIVDYVIIMPFLTRRTEAPPGPISPDNETKSVLKYVLSVIPADKIFISFPIYAKDWVIPYVKGHETSTISIQEAMNRAYKYRAKIHFDELSQSPFFNYVDEENKMHEVWFDDARSAIAKFNIVKENNVRGLSYWTLGYPFPQNWRLLAENFVIIKQ